MNKLCVYVVDHDTGFAPNATPKACCLKGCKQRTIERNAVPGDWIIGIGGKRTGKGADRAGEYDRRLIYAMKVEANRGDEPRSREFWYYGKKAILLPPRLSVLAPTAARFRTRYFWRSENPNLFKEFERFMRRRPEKGKIGCPCDIKSSSHCRG